MSWSSVKESVEGAIESILSGAFDAVAGALKVAPAYNDEQILTDQSSNNSAPTGDAGTVFLESTKDVNVEIKADGTITNVDINVWLRSPNGEWFIHATQLDLQDLVNDFWNFNIPGARGFGNDIYIEVAAYSGTGNVNAHMRESTI